MTRHGQALYPAQCNPPVPLPKAEAGRSSGITPSALTLLAAHLTAGLGRTKAG